MDRISCVSAIDQKMAEMRIKNLELLKRHQEIEEDRQLAQHSGLTVATPTGVESTLNTESMTTTMRTSTKNRGRNTMNQQNSQKNSEEHVQRSATRRKIEHDRNDNQSQRTQRVDYNRLKRERTQEFSNQHYNNNVNNNNNNNSIINPELLEYAYPFHYRSEDNHDAGETAHANKIIIVNNQGNRTGSGRFNQYQQRAQDQGQRRREDRMRRSALYNSGHSGETSEFHLDIPQIPMWQSSSLPPPIHIQLLPANINGHHTNLDHFMNGGGDQLDQSACSHNFIYSSPAPTSPFNGNGTVYFAHPPSPMSNGPPPSQPSPVHFHQYYPTRTFENSNRHQFHHQPHFQPSTVFQTPPPPPLLTQPQIPIPPPLTIPPQLSTPSTSMLNLNQEREDTSADLPPRFRRIKNPDQNNMYSNQRPLSGDFEHLHNSSSHFNNDKRFQARPQSFYDFSSQQQSNMNIFRPSSNNNNHHPRNKNNSSLPLSAYMNINDSSYSNENNNNNNNNNNNSNNNYWGAFYQRRRPSKPRTYYHDKHQFPLSSYDPRHYGFNYNYQKRNDLTNRSNANRHNSNNNMHNANDIDLIEEWWEDDNTELIGTNQSTNNTDPQMTTTTTTTVDDSGNSSLSTSIHLKESTLDDDENHPLTHDFISPPSDVSTTDSNIIESLDQLQQQLKLEEAVEKQLAAESDDIDKELLSLNKEPTTYDTAHFLEWAKEKFREELAVRLTAQEIQQHDAVTTDDDDDDILVTANIHLDKYRIDQITDEENNNHFDHMDDLEDDLHEKLTIEDLSSKPIVVE